MEVCHKSHNFAAPRIIFEPFEPPRVLRDKLRVRPGGGWLPGRTYAVYPSWNVDMRVFKIAGAAIAAILVVIVLLLVVGIPSGFVNATIRDHVERATGYRLTVAGTTKISLWPQLNFTLSDIMLQDPKDRDGANRITIG